MQKKQNSLIWFTNNLRIHDNECLRQACSNSVNVIGLYCFDPRHFETDCFGFKKTEKFRAHFLIDSVQNLQKQLKKYNISLLIYFKKPEDCISKICTEFTINTIYKLNEWTSEEQQVHKNVKATLTESTNVISYYDSFLFHPDDIPFKTDEIPQVFTNFRKKLEKTVEIRPLSDIQKMPETNFIEHATNTPTLEDLGITKFQMHPKSAFPFKGGETSALARLDNYFFETKKLGFYKKTRNGLLGKDYSSKFSPWLANGSMSAKMIYHKVKEFESEHFKNQSTYWLIFELIWRDYFKYISLKHQNKIFKIGGILDKQYDWKNNNQIIKQWIDGTTKSDFVNANMIELKQTGWMSNRGRQNVASYFAKELLLDWRIGASYFESMLLDYDVHSNYGNWLYVAGIGNDPRNRKFNVQLQAERYDANHTFRKLWLQTSLF